MMRYLIFALVLVTPFLVSAEGFDRDLQFGMQNDSDVIKLQKLLTDEGLYFGPISGNYFSLTQKAVKNFQVREGIKPASGYFGSKTRTKANTVLAVSVNVSKDDVSIKNILSPDPVASVIPAKTEGNKSDVISSMMDQVAILQKQIDFLLKKTTPIPLEQKTIVPSQTPVVIQTIEEPIKPMVSSADQSSSVGVSTAPVQSSSITQTQPQNTTAQVTGNTTSSSVVNTWANGSFNAIGPNGIDYGTVGTLQSH